MMALVKHAYKQGTLNRQSWKSRCECVLFQFAVNQKFAFWPFGKTTHNILEMMPLLQLVLLCTYYILLCHLSVFLSICPGLNELHLSIRHMHSFKLRYFQLIWILCFLHDFFLIEFDLNLTIKLMFFLTNHTIPAPANRRTLNKENF